MTKIKICGMVRKQDIEYVNEALPDYIGFVFAKSKRQVTPEQARELKTILNPRILAVGVFVDAPISEIACICKAGTIDLVQLHGKEEALYIQELRKKISQPMIKAVSIKPGIQLRDENVDYYLFDHGKGGTGKAFDWNLIPQTQKPFFLAGGLNAENLRLAARKIGPYAVDLSSGVETDGVKDREKIMEAVRSVKNE